MANPSLINVAVIIVIAYALCYFISTLTLSIGIRRFGGRKLPDTLPSVSVIVCARNEEDDLPACLESLSHIDYPAEKLEILIIDDESDDRTPEIIADYVARVPAMKSLSTTGEPKVLPAKQRPMNLGIMTAVGDIIVVTDADCTVSPGWVKAHVTAYADTVGIVGGITRVQTKKGGLWARLQNCDLATKLAVAMGCAGIGAPLTIMGNNISFRRKIYVDLGGYGGIRSSIVEDMALMNAVIKKTKYRLSWAHGADGVAVATPERTIDTFLGQRQRWIHEIGDLSSIGKMLIAVETIMTFVVLIGAVIAPVTVWPLIVAVVSWSLGYLIMLSATPGISVGTIIFVPLMYLFQFGYWMIIINRSLTGRGTIVWKGRMYDGKK